MAINPYNPSEEQLYIAAVKARKGLLIGGVLRHESAPLDTWQDAVEWSNIVIETNKEDGREPMYDGIRSITREED
jgi:hypothetical protein